MKHRDLMLGVWAVGAFLWIAIRFWRGSFTCFYGTYPWCEYWTTSNYIEVLVDAFAIPLGALVALLVVIWVRGGFRKSPPSI